MKATMKQIVAANRVGIISTPNQPTYRRLFVEVTQSQKLSQVDAPCWRERVEAIVIEKSKTIREMVELLFPVTLRQDMRDGLVDLPSLGQTAGVRQFTFRNR